MIKLIINFPVLNPPCHSAADDMNTGFRKEEDSICLSNNNGRTQGVKKLDAHNNLSYLFDTAAILMTSRLRVHLAAQSDCDKYNNKDNFPPRKTGGHELNKL